MSLPGRSRLIERVPSRRCANCSLRLPPNLRRRQIGDIDEAMLTLLRTWVTPTEISPDDILCLECCLLLQDRVSNMSSPHLPEISPPLGHINVCYACGISTASRRTHRVSHDCPQRMVILRWMPAHHIQRLEQVCRACWEAATRNLQRVPLLDITNQPALVETGDSRHVADLHVVIPEPPPAPAPLPPPPTQQLPRIQPKIISSKYKRVSASSRHCVFSGCENMDRLLLPSAIKEVSLLQHNIYIPLTARICQEHLLSNSWEQLDAPYSDFTGFQVDDIFTKLEKAAERQFDFSDINSMDPHLCHYWLGLNANQFNELITSMPMLYDHFPNPSVALSIFLVKLRTGDSNQRLSTLFKMPRATLERKMNIVRNCMNEQFVPRYLGISHMTIQDVASRNRTIPEGFYGNSNMEPNIKPAIVICDGTYVYVESSSNYSYQKKTYSLYKYANLVKPFLIVCCDGYILDCIGPFEATKSDSSIMSDMFRNENGPMRSFFRLGDVFILDRGFRDVIPELQSYNYKTHISPESLLENEFQLTTEQANKSRCVTMCRWVVEVVNGRIKRDFKLFRQDYFNRASRHLMIDFKIACSLLNKYHPTIDDRPEAEEYLNIALSRLNSINYLSEFVQRERLNRRRTIFQSIDSNASHLDTFPRLTLSDLRRFALGSYQLKQARSYFGEHVRPNGRYIVEISNELEDDLPLVFSLNNYLLRARIKSRHISSKVYNCYLLLSRDQSRANSLESIIAYYCHCLVGNRTVGCCAHTMTVLWYLSWGRFNDVRAPAPFLDNIFYEE